MVFANKQDIHSAVPLEEVEDVFKVNDVLVASAYARKQKMVAVSALTCAGVEEGVKWLVDQIVEDEAILSRSRPR